MASVAQHTATTGTSPITIKVAFEGSNRKFKLPLQDLNAATFAQKVCTYQPQPRVICIIPYQSC